MLKLTPALDTIINQEGNMRVFFNGTNPYLAESVLQVRFDSVAQGFEEEHVLMLYSEFPPSAQLRALDLYCLFPNTRNARNRILIPQRFWSLDSFNLAMNKALSDSTAESVNGLCTKFALAFGSHVVGFGDVQGTLYLVWAQSLTFYNADKAVVRILYDCPMLVNMNGEAIVTGIYVIEAQGKSWSTPLPMVQNERVRTPTLLGNHAELWVCEKRPERMESGPRVRVLGYDEAVNYATRPSRNTQDWVVLSGGLERDLFVLEDPAASSAAAEHVVEAETYDWHATPRGLFASVPAFGLQPVLSPPPPSSSSLPSGPRDPFQEYPE